MSVVSGVEAHCVRRTACEGVVPLFSRQVEICVRPNVRRRGRFQAAMRTREGQEGVPFIGGTYVFTIINAVSHAIVLVTIIGLPLLSPEGRSIAFS